jgi:ABC-type transport system substrate-binding protein
MPCVAARDAHAPDRQGPFKFVSFKANESIRVERNPDYWKPGRPYLGWSKKSWGKRTVTSHSGQ